MEKKMHRPGNIHLMKVHSIHDAGCKTLGNA